MWDYLQRSVLLNVNKWLDQSVFFLTVLFVLGSVNVHGQDKESKHVLWEVSKNEEVKGYLMGTIHFVDSTFYPIDPIYIDVLKKSNPIVFELKDINKPKMNILMGMLQSGIYKNGETLKQQLPSKIYEKTEKRLAEAGIPNPNYFKPWMVALIIHSLNTSDEGRNSGGLDSFMQEKAEKHRKDIKGLEKPEEQLKAFSKQTTEGQIEFLKYVLDVKIDTVSETSNESDYRLDDYWKAGDIKNIQNLIQGENFENIANVSNEMREYLVIERNKKWKNKIETIFKNEDIPMIVVGLGHLLEKDNLIDLLKADNYKVKQL